MGRGGQMRGMGQTGSVVMGRGGQTGAVVMGRGGQMIRGRGQSVRGGGMMTGGQVRSVVGGQRVTPTKVVTRGGMMNMGAGRGQMMRPGLRGGVIQQHNSRGGVQIIRGGGAVHRPRMAQPMTIQPQSRRGRPPSGSVVMNQAPMVQQQHNRTIYQNQAARKIVPQPRPRAPSPTGSLVSAVSSWHTPSLNRPVSPPKTNDNFKIKLPKMSGGSNSNLKPESIDIDDDIISIDPPSPSTINNSNNINTRRPDPLINRPGLNISRGPSHNPSQDEGVDPLSLDDDQPRAIKLEKPQNKNNTAVIAAPDFSSLIDDDDDISTTGDWINNSSSKKDKTNMSVVSGMTTLKTENVNKIKVS